MSHRRQLHHQRAGSASEIPARAAACVSGRPDQLVGRVRVERDRRGTSTASAGALAGDGHGSRPAGGGGQQLGDLSCQAAPPCRQPITPARASTCIWVAGTWGCSGRARAAVVGQAETWLRRAGPRTPRRRRHAPLPPCCCCCSCGPPPAHQACPQHLTHADGCMVGARHAPWQQQCPWGCAAGGDLRPAATRRRCPCTGSHPALP